MHRFKWPWLVATAFAAFGSTVPLAAQIDYRNLDGHRPTRVTDAYPIERYAFELTLPYGFSRASGVSTHTVSPHLEYGIGRNLMVGFGAEIADRAAETTLGVGGLWNVRRETPSWPGFGLSFEVTQPLDGARFGADASVALGALATRSVGRSRLHLNAAAAVLRPDAAARWTEPAWWAGLAWDYTLFRTSTLLVAELFAEDHGGGEEVDWVAGFGARRQLTPTLVIHGGIERSLRSGRSATEINLGLSHAFAVRALMRGGRP